MLSIKICTVYYIFLNIVAEIHSLIPLSIIEDNNIGTTEEAVRNTVNSLFAAFKIHGVGYRSKIKQLSTIHNFFVSITLIDCDNLAEIARLSRVNIVDNNTQNFIAQINEVLNTDDKSKEENDNNIYVATHIQNFIQKLKHLKESYLPNHNNVVNKKVLAYMDFDTLTRENEIEDNTNTSESNQDLKDDKISNTSDIWQASGRRIYQGRRTSIKKFPFMASIHFFEKFACAGSIIKNDLVITSASCLQIAWNNRFFRENPAFLSVRVGCEYYDYCGESISVLEVYFYPQYDPNVLKHNIAIMRLKRKINFRRTHGRVKKIEVDKNPWPLPNTCTVTVVGWGAKESSNIIYDVLRNKLSFAKLDMYLLKDCQEHYSKEFVTEKNFCAGFYSKGGGACNRDAGGPGIYDDTLIGVISFGSPLCGYAGAPTVFTKLGFYWGWIENIMQHEIVSYGSQTTRPPSTIFTFAVKSTTEEIKIYPFGDTPSTSAIEETEALRMTQELEFKDFLSTIFESDEFNSIKDTTDTGDKINVERIAATDDTQKELNEFTDDDDENSIETPIESQKGVTMLNYANNDDKIIGDEDSNDKIDGSKRNDENEQANSPKLLDKDVMALIDDLDIDELLRSLIPSDSTLKDDKLKENTKYLNETSIERNIAISNNLENKLEISSIQKPSPNLIIDENGDWEEDGLSIEVGPFIASKMKGRHNDFTMHQSSTPYTVATKMKKINKMKRYIL